MTGSRPQQTATRPGLEPGTPWSVVTISEILTVASFYSRGGLFGSDLAINPERLFFLRQGSFDMYNFVLIHQVPAGGAKKPGEKGPTEGIEVALNPEELDLDTAAMQAKYDQTMREQQSQIEKEDLSDMVAEHAAKQKVSNCRLLYRKISFILGLFKIWCNHLQNETI